MSIIVSHNSALEYLRSVPPQERGDNRTTEPLEIPGPPGKHELSLLKTARLGTRQESTHLLTSRNHAQIRASSVLPHQSSLGEIPAGLLLDAGNDIYVCGPELVFIQMLSRISPLGSIVLGYELCGSYSHFAPLISGFYDRPALTTKQRVLDAVELMPGAHNVEKARKVLDLILEGSASPMETVTSNILFLPESMGGQSLVMPEINYEVKLDDVASRITGTRTCVIDGAWPELDKGYEYNGGDHTDPIKDRNRLEALAHMGYSIYTIDANRMMDFSELKKVVNLITSDVPRRGGFGAPDEESMRQLHRRLLTSTRCGLGLDAALFGVPVKGLGIRTHL